MALFKREKISVLKVVTYRMVQSWALNTASRMCIQAAWIRDQAMNGRKGILKLLIHSE